MTLSDKSSLGIIWTLVNTDGVPVTDETYHGKHAIIYFGFTHCPDVCPDGLLTPSSTSLPAGR